MSLPIFYTDSIQTSNFLTLSEDTSRHVVQVLRMKIGEELQLTDGKGNLATCAIVDDHKKKCTVKVVTSEFIEKPSRQISIAISLLKNSTRFEWFLEKATEIGVTEIIPLLCDRTEKQHFRFERMNNVLIAAMLQSQQVWLPVLFQPLAYQKVVTSSLYTTKLIAHCEELEKQFIKEFAAGNSIQILIGPEGDFTREEIEMALFEKFKAVSLGNTRLRTETSGVVAAALLCNG